MKSRHGKIGRASSKEQTRSDVVQLLSEEDSWHDSFQDRQWVSVLVRKIPGLNDNAYGIYRNNSYCPEFVARPHDSLSQLAFEDSVLEIPFQFPISYPVRYINSNIKAPLSVLKYIIHSNQEIPLPPSIDMEHALLNHCIALSSDNSVLHKKLEQKKNYLVSRALSSFVDIAVFATAAKEVFHDSSRAFTIRTPEHNRGYFGETQSSFYSHGVTLAGNDIIVNALESLDLILQIEQREQGRKSGQNPIRVLNDPDLLNALYDLLLPLDQIHHPAEQSDLRMILPDFYPMNCIRSRREVPSSKLGENSIPGFSFSHSDGVISREDIIVVDLDRYVYRIPEVNLVRYLSAPYVGINTKGIEHYAGKVFDLFNHQIDVLHEVQSLRPGLFNTSPAMNKSKEQFEQFSLIAALYEAGFHGPGVGCKRQLFVPHRYKRMLGQNQRSFAHVRYDYNNGGEKKVESLSINPELVRSLSGGSSNFLIAPDRLTFKHGSHYDNSKLIPAYMKLAMSLCEELVKQDPQNTESYKCLEELFSNIQTKTANQYIEKIKAKL